MKMDVYFTGAPKGVTASTISFVQSWDGSIYAETNCRDFAGKDRDVTFSGTCLATNGDFYVDGTLVNGRPYHVDLMKIKCPVCEHEQSFLSWIKGNCQVCILNAKEDDFFDDFDEDLPEDEVSADISWMVDEDLDEFYDHEDHAD